MGLECSADPSGPPVAWTHFSREFRVRVRIKRILAKAPSKTRHISKSSSWSREPFDFVGFRTGRSRAGEAPLPKALKCNASQTPAWKFACFRSSEPLSSGSAGGAGAEAAASARRLACD